MHSRAPWTLCLLATLACAPQSGGPGTEDDGSPKCDGILQEDEKPYKDGPWDLDGDGFVTADDPACAAAYPSSQLDCDDDDPNLSPNALEITCNGLDDDCDPSTDDDADRDGDDVTECEGDCDDEDDERSPAYGETCWDLVDNDCDGDIDEDCGPDYNGRFAVDGGAVDFQCGGIFVNMEFYAIDVIYIPPYIEFVPVGPGGQPSSMGGEIPSGETAFDVRHWVILGTALSCSEFYMMVGEFTSVDTIELVFDFWYEPGGPAFACLNCPTDPISLPLTLTRVPTNWTPGTTGTGTGTGATGTGTGATGTGTGATGTGTGATGTGTGATGTGTGTVP